MTLLISCKKIANNDKGKWVDDEGILIEKFENNENENRYTEDNIIFKEESEFIYDFFHITKKNDTLLFKQVIENGNKKQWDFVPINSKKDAISKVKITTLKGLQPIVKYIPDYNQTIIKYQYILEDGNSIEYNSVSGVVENEKNIWMHPPRDFYFEILELNPFPYIKFPCKLGKKWNWNLRVGEKWADNRWKEWNGSIDINYVYKIIDYQPIILKDTKKLDCYIIEAKAISELGGTELISWFHPKYGFVKLEYKNIDGSSTILNLVSINEY